MIVDTLSMLAEKRRVFSAVSFCCITDKPELFVRRRRRKRDKRSKHRPHSETSARIFGDLNGIKFFSLSHSVHAWRDSLIIRGMFLIVSLLACKSFYEFYRQCSSYSYLIIFVFSLQNSRIFLIKEEPLQLFIRQPF